MSYHWTDPDLGPVSLGSDAIEVAGCIDGGDFIERVDRSEKADLFSVYVHHEGRGATCVADRDTVEEAVAFGRELAANLGVPLYDYAS